MTSSELSALIERDIPEGKQSLESSCANLERVAAYCEANYLHAEDKAAALEETKRFTIQSLASVSYQVNSLATNLLQMLDLQCDRVEDMQYQVDNIANMIDVHKEKVARREIGALTKNRFVPRQHKIIAPTQDEKPQRYVRQGIDYTKFDDLGHGVQRNQQLRDSRIPPGRTASTVSGGSTNSSGSANLPMPQYILSAQQDPQQRFNVERMNQPLRGEYRVPVTVASNSHISSNILNPEYASRLVQYQMSSGASNGPPSNYTALSVSSSRSSGQASSTVGPAGYGVVMSNGSGYMVQSDELPPPPMDLFQAGEMEINSMVPPPPEFMMEEPCSVTPVPGAQSRRPTDPDWAPPIYLEKVVAVYAYDADKPDELSFGENAVIYVLKKNQDGWFEGVFDGVTGLFPGNYVEPCI